MRKSHDRVPERERFQARPSAAMHAPARRESTDVGLFGGVPGEVMARSPSFGVKPTARRSFTYWCSPGASSGSGLA